GAGPLRSALPLLRFFNLSGNALTRVAAAGVGSAEWASARKGLLAFADFIAGSPALRVLDLSDCSLLPDGPAACLYSPDLSVELAKAIASGLSRRVSSRLVSNHV
ncbi:unnamed protein product, partial [Discosporangium mesarthrocarpum]